MSVFLSTTREAAGLGDADAWFSTMTGPSAAEPAALPRARRLRGVSEHLEAAFDAIRDEWLAIARKTTGDPNQELAHMPTLSTYASDFGMMLAWRRLTAEVAKGREAVLVLCDDPWLFRALAALDGVTVPGRTPALWPRLLGAHGRGWLARAAAVGRVAWYWWAARRGRRDIAPGGKWILVYGHPESDAEGNDAYFGDLMRQVPGLRRLLHTDCGWSRARALAADGRTVSLHAFGDIRLLPALFLARWKPRPPAGNVGTAWLVRRAGVLEASGAAAAMTRWQISCQSRWLRRARPAVIAWPWENHPWERAFARAAKSVGTRCMGYQHSVVGRHMYNQGADTNLDGDASLPDVVLCNGRAYGRDLAAWGMPHERLVEAGAFRLRGASRMSFSPNGPILIALSNDPFLARQMTEAARPLAGTGRRFLVKEHPMCQFPFEESEGFTRTEQPFAAMPPLSRVIYCTGTSGLEAYLAGIPVLRFKPAGRVAMNVLPAEVDIVSVDAEGLAAALDRPPLLPAANRASLLSEPDPEFWRALFETGAPAALKDAS